jgi:hypothetical protein
MRRAPGGRIRVIRPSRGDRRVQVDLDPLALAANAR